MNLGPGLMRIQNYRIQLPEASFSWFSLSLLNQGDWLNQGLEGKKHEKGGMSITVLNKCVLKHSRGL